MNQNGTILDVLDVLPRKISGRKITVVRLGNKASLHNYERINVLHGEEARELILQQLASHPKTCNELATALGKARTIIQAWHMPILKREGRVKRIGKRVKLGSLRLRKAK